MIKSDKTILPADLLQAAGRMVNIFLLEYCIT